MPKITLYSPYPTGLVPSARFRYEQYILFLKDKGFTITQLNLLTSEASQPKNKLIFGLLILYRTALQFIRSFRSTSSDFIFIHREIAIGPPVIEWILVTIFKKKIIYDFDDAIWLTDKGNESWLEEKLRWRNKVSLICKWSYKISIGNSYLADYARQFNGNVIVNPTTVDTRGLHYPKNYNIIKSPSRIIIGWTGSRSTLKYLEELQPVLSEIEKTYPLLRILVIADLYPKLDLKNLEFRKWSKEKEIEDLLQIDIGLMPLPNDPWTRGKCGFKALQYMALEIPALVSPVGINKDIVQHGIQGYWCDQEKDWVNYITELIENPSLRKKMGENGRQRVIDNYSVESNKSNFLSLFE